MTAKVGRMIDFAALLHSNHIFTAVLRVYTLNASNLQNTSLIYECLSVIMTDLSVSQAPLPRFELGVDSSRVKGGEHRYHCGREIP